MLSKLFHKWLNPHCPDCQLESIESKICNSCEILKSEIMQLRLERDKLLDNLLNKPVVPEINASNEPVENFKAVQHHVPFSVTRQKLEREDREEAKRREEIRLRRDAETDAKTAKLENEVLGQAG